LRSLTVGDAPSPACHRAVTGLLPRGRHAGPTVPEPRNTGAPPDEDGTKHERECGGMRWISSVRWQAMRAALPLFALGWVVFGVSGNRWN